MRPVHRFLATALGAVLAAGATDLRAQTPADPSPFEFLGFGAGAHLADVRERLAELDGSALKCDRSRADRRVQECRARFIDPDGGGDVELWISAIDSVAGVLTVGGAVDGEQLDGWRDALQRRYGSADARVQGPQWMMQWVRRGRMVRLTWKVERGEKVASVSLVDGRVLDGWGRERSGRGG
jgi:hypothetical protein